MTARRRTLLSCNIQAGNQTRAYHHYLTRGWSHVLPNGKQHSLAALADVFRPFDLVGLQESDPGSLRSGFANQTLELAERAGFPFWSHQPNRSVGRIAGSANGLLSREPPREVFDYPLPGRIAGRGLLLAQFGDGPTAWWLGITHLSLGAASRRAQVDFLAERLANHPRAVLMGDFNCPDDAAEMQAIYRNTSLQPAGPGLPSFPSWKPRRAIDLVLVAGFKVVGREVVPAAGSDHLGIAVTLDDPLSAAPSPTG